MKNKIASMVLQFMVFFLIAFVYLFSCLDVINVQIDDTFITLRYVRNLLSGNGLVFNIGEHVEGFSNPTWLFLVAFFAKVLGVTTHLPVFYLTKTLGVAMGFCTIIIWFMILKQTDNHIAVICSALFVIAINPFLNTYNTSGLETSLVNFLLALVVLFYLKWQASPKRLYVMVLSIALGLLSISRPEGIIYPVSIFIGIFLVQSINKKKITTSMLVSLPITFLIFFGYLFFRWNYYHELLPNTLFAKNNPSPSTFIDGAFYAIMFFAFSTSPFIFLTFLKVSPKHVLKWPQLPLYLIILAQYSFAVYAGGDWMPAYRLLLPILPISYFLIFDQLDVKNLPTTKLVFLFLVLFIAVGATWVIGRDRIVQNSPYTTGFKMALDVYDKDYYDIAQKLSGMTNDNDLVLIGEAGLIPYFNDQVRFIDLYGLTDKHLAKDVKGAHSSRLDNDYFFSHDFTYFVAMTSSEFVLNEVTSSYSTGHYPVDAILIDPRFIRNYALVYYNNSGGIFRKKDN